MIAGGVPPAGSGLQVAEASLAAGDEMLDLRPVRRPGDEPAVTAVLATVRCGEPASVRAVARPGSVPLLPAGEVCLPLPLIHGHSTERWLAVDRVVCGRAGDLLWTADGTTFLAALAVDEAAVGRAAGIDLEIATAHAYRRLLAVARREGYAHPWRLWNVLPHINADDAGLERYQRFCRARAEAFETAWGGSFEARLCSSTAVGCHDGSSLVALLLAGRVAAVHRENPRQVSAYRYPQRYGPRSPSFARATVLPAELGGTLFVSGTASIVGHQTLHVGDLLAQLEETCRNLDAMLACPDAEEREVPRRLLALRVYLRHPEDWPAVRAGLAARYGSEVPTTVLWADICRADLLLEIEAVAQP